MRSSRSLFGVVAVTLLSLLVTAIASVAGVDLVTSGPFALAGFALLTLVQATFVPVFFAALYVDIGVVRASEDRWAPSHWRWVGGGVLATVVAYATLHNTTAVVVPVGLAYLARRVHAARRFSGAQPSDPPTDEGTPGAHSVAGVVVHLLALAAGIAAFVLTSDIAAAGLAFAGVAALVLAASQNSFTRANARNALNWSLSVLVFAIVSAIPTVLYAMDGQFYGYTVSGPILPSALDSAVKTGSFALVIATMLALVATVCFAAFAAWRAAMGTPWSYPFAASVVEWLGRLTAD